MLHYEDATLRDLYFLDPQWLCDMLSHVVTIREINPFAKNGIMKLEDLRHVFKSSSAVTLNAKSYVVNLLNKFEVALTWDSRTLLIPSLLPTEQQVYFFCAKFCGIKLKKFYLCTLLCNLIDAKWHPWFGHESKSSSEVTRLGISRSKKP